MGPDEEGEGGRSRDEAEWIRRFSLVVPPRCLLLLPRSTAKRKAEKLAEGMEAERERGKAGKGGMYTNRRKKERSLLWLSAQTLPRCLRRRRRRLPFGVENPFNSKLFSYSRGLLFPLFSPSTLFFPFIFTSIHMEIKEVQ